MNTIGGKEICQIARNAVIVRKRVGLQSAYQATDVNGAAYV